MATEREETKKYLGTTRKLRRLHFLSASLALLGQYLGTSLAPLFCSACHCWRRIPPPLLLLNPPHRPQAANFVLASPDAS